MTTHFGGPLRVGQNFTQNGSATLPGGPADNIAVYNVVPATIDADGIATAQAVSGAGNLTLNGALASGGSVTLDCARGVQILSTDAADTTQTATFYGTDTYGVSMTETLTFNGTNAVAGKKAFKTVTRVAISATMAGNASAGSSDVFGLPFVLGDINYCLKVSWASVLAADAATVVAAVATDPATATTGDVRGTVDPSSASDGSRRLTVYQYLTPTQVNTRAGLYGVTQA